MVASVVRRSSRSTALLSSDGERVLGDGDLPDRPVAGLGAGEQFGAAVGRVRAVLGQAALDQQVGDALDRPAG